MIPNSKHINAYIDFCNESRGISNTIKDYIDILVPYFTESKDFIINLTNNNLPLFNLIIDINFTDNWNSIFNPKNFYLKDNKLYDCHLTFNVKDEQVKIESLIAHELTHALEFYNLVKNHRDIPKHGKLKLKLNKFKLNNYDNFFDAFIHYVYLTLDNEFNARIAELYPYLKSKNTRNKQELIEHIYHSDVWLKIKEIELFDEKRFSDFLIDKLGLKATIQYLNLFDKSLEEFSLKMSIKDYNDIVDYFKRWKKILNKGLNKHKNKALNIINEI